MLLALALNVTSSIAVKRAALAPVLLLCGLDSELVM
jgi:hypothetical protein